MNQGYLSNMVKDALKLLDSYSEPTEYMLAGHRAYLESYHVLELVVPRCTGKTTLLKELFNNTSSLLIVQSHQFTNNSTTGIISKYSIGTYIRSLIGLRNTNNKKYQYILLDECDILKTAEFYELIISLKLANMLVKDFHILSLRSL